MLEKSLKTIHASQSALVVWTGLLVMCLSLMAGFSGIARSETNGFVPPGTSADNRTHVIASNPAPLMPAELPRFNAQNHLAKTAGPVSYSKVLPVPFEQRVLSSYVVLSADDAQVWPYPRLHFFQVLRR